MYADANGSHSIREKLADKMVETKIWNRRKSLIFQSVARFVPQKAGIQVFPGDRHHRTKRLLAEKIFVVLSKIS